MEKIGLLRVFVLVITSLRGRFRVGDIQEKRKAFSIVKIGDGDKRGCSDGNYLPPLTFKLLVRVTKREKG